MIRRSIALIAVLLALALALKVIAASADEDDEDETIVSSAVHLSRDRAGRVIIALTPSAQKAAGIITATVPPLIRRIEVEAYGQVLDPEPLAALDSELAAARAQLRAARAQYERTRRLYQENNNASLRDLQSAQVQYFSDRSRCQLLQQQLRNGWGSEIARLSGKARLRLISALVDRREALARVTVPMGAPVASTSDSASVSVAGYEDQPIVARAVYYAPSIARGMPGQTLLILLAADGIEIPAGSAIFARIPTAAGALVHGVMVARSAIVRYAGRSWVYQALDVGRFTRRPIRVAQITEQGYFVTDLPPGTRIVRAGAQVLLSAELKDQIRIQD
ncbi:MAG TPA: hypothetical protein VKV28_01360 [Candidatus Binataceae bacterium]|nr:hypothetical protein [Candidatus Binataceae bacterium]